MEIFDYTKKPLKDYFNVTNFLFGRRHCIIKVNRMQYKRLINYYYHENNFNTKCYQRNVRIDVEDE